MGTGALEGQDSGRIFAGLIVNGQQTTECWLYPGDVIQIGPRRYTIDYATRVGGRTGENR